MADNNGIPGAGWAAVSGQAQVSMVKEVMLTAENDGRARQPAGRSRRVAALLVLLTVFSYFDLAFTQSQAQRLQFVEANMLAAMIADGPATRAVYKLATFGVGAAILFRCRRHWQAECATWGLALCFAGLMVWWVAYMDTVEVFLESPLAPTRHWGTALVDAGPSNIVPAALLGAR